MTMGVLQGSILGLSLVILGINHLISFYKNIDRNAPQLWRPINRKSLAQCMLAVIMKGAFTKMIFSYYGVGN